MKQRQTGAGTIAALALACVFGATMLLSLATGASVYRRVADRVDQGREQRIGLTYITAKVHAFDEAGMVRVDRFGGTDAVVLQREMDGDIYETVLYVYDGWLRELLREKDVELAPEAGQSIMEATSLSVSQTASGLLRFDYTDANGRAETALVNLRGGG